MIHTKGSAKLSWFFTLRGKFLLTQDDSYAEILYNISHKLVIIDFTKHCIYL